MRLLLISFAVFLAVSCATPQEPASGATARPRITLVLVCDVYKMGENKGRGGMARIAAVLKAEKARHANVLIVHAGDTLSPSLMSGFDQGAHIVDLFNMTPLDVFVPGNHEFDFGREVFLKRMGEFKADVVVANLRDGDGKPIAGIEDAKLIEIGGIKLGLIGLTADDSAVTSRPGRLRFSESLSTAEREAARLRKAGAELIVLVPHAGRDLDEKLFASGVADVILSGHDHDLYMRFNEKTAIAEAGADGMVVVAVDLELDIEARPDGSRRVRWWPRFRFIDTVDVAPDADVAARVAMYEAKLDADLGQPIGRTATELDSRNAAVRGGEAVIGNLFADALRERANADVTLINGGGFRGGRVYPADSALSRKEVLTELPFLNKAYVLEVTGATLKAALEAGFSGAENEVGRFPQVSGMRVKADLTRPDGRRVVAVEIGGRPLSDAQVYKLVTNDYLANGGDGYTPLKSAKVLRGDADADLVANIVIDYIMAKGTVSPKLDGRIMVARARPAG
jgi:2',3'-cyclic-nucleotide 2'-phosphodiesterase (5'-nucleotidase family)